MKYRGRTRIKICGICRPEDAKAAAALGVDALGLVFYSASPRYVEIAQAQAIAACLPPFVSLVGLFVNASAEWVNQVIEAVPLSLLQFHGDETNAMCLQFGMPFLKAVRIGQAGTQAGTTAELLKAFPAASGLLLDTWHPQRFGGTGQVFDWSMIPEHLAHPVILAGGLRPDNVRQAIAQVRPWAVDVSGGVESAPGVKEWALMQAFVEGVNDV